MRIRRFNESEIGDMSPDRVVEIVQSLTTMSSDMDQRVEVIDSFINELNNFKSISKSSNDQIDDSISNLEIARGLFKDSLDKIDNVVNNMRDYNQNGRKYLYDDKTF
jgi:ABC-type transporter Mla subunit MlaD